jgi:hypothetical protein
MSLNVVSFDACLDFDLVHLVFLLTGLKHKRNENIVMEVKIESLTDYIKHNQENWRILMNGGNTGRFQKAILRYRP